MSGGPTESFFQQLDSCVRDGSFVRLILGKPRGSDPTLLKILVRPVELKAGARLSFLWRHDRRDITKNLSTDEALAEVRRLLGDSFHSAHLFTTARTVQLEFNKRREPRLTTGSAAAESPATGHDRRKERLLPESSSVWLKSLGVLNPQGAVRDGMADKHRQIHKFVEILSHLVSDARFPGDRPLEVADMGCGKGYLTFAAHDYFNRVANRPANVLGIEARAELVDTCNRVARASGADRLGFSTGTIADAKLEHIDALIALHACDTATDDAIARGIAAGAALIVVAPCCQKELRPQLRAGGPLAPPLRHGIFQERHAEFATDALRALLLEWAGYDTKVFEFISTEHTAKNTMIAATRRADSTGRDETRAAPIRELAGLYGIRTQALARQLNFELQT